MTFQIRTELKKIVPSSLWPYFRMVDRYIIDGLYIGFAIRRYLFSRGTIRHRHPLKQSVSVYRSYVPLGQNASADYLTSRFTGEGIQYKSGRHTIYLGDARDIARINPDLLNQYPYSFGLKIIKSRQLSPDSTPYYTSSELAPASSWFSMYAVGTVLDKVIISNLLYRENVAPSVYDVIRLESDDGGWQYGLIVQNVSGPVVTGNEGLEFIGRFKSALKKYGLKTISIKEHSDLRPPEFRHNIIRGDRPYYVDIQNFVMQSRRFPDEVFGHQTDRQSPGLSNELLNRVFRLSEKKQLFNEKIERKSNALRAFFERNDLPVETYTVVDKSCSFGLFHMFYLHLGGKWCEIECSREDGNTPYFLITLMGYSRFTLVFPGENNTVSREGITGNPHGRRLVFMRAAGNICRAERGPLSPDDVLIIEADLSVNASSGEAEPYLVEGMQSVGVFELAKEDDSVLAWCLYKNNTAEL